MGDISLSSVRTAGSRLLLGGSWLILGGSRQILGWFLVRSQPKRAKMPQDSQRGGQMGQEASKISEKGDLGDPKRLPEASQNTKNTRFDVRSVMEGDKKGGRDSLPPRFGFILGCILESKIHGKSIHKSITFLIRF